MTEPKQFGGNPLLIGEPYRLLNLFPIQALVCNCTEAGVPLPVAAKWDAVILCPSCGRSYRLRTLTYDRTRNHIDAQYEVGVARTDGVVPS